MSNKSPMLAAEAFGKQREKEERGGRRYVNEPSRLARNGIIYLSTGEDCICVQDPPPNHPAYGISDNQALRVVAAVGRSNASIVEVEFGTVQADTVKLNKFVRDEGRETMCLKAIDYYDPDNPYGDDPLLEEFLANSAALTRAGEDLALAYETFVPTISWSIASYQTEQSMKGKEKASGEERLKVLLMPLHIPLLTILDDPAVSDAEKNALWEDAYTTTRQLHRLQSVHRDLKTDNIVVKARRNTEGVLEPDKSSGRMKTLLIDMADSRELKEMYLSDVKYAGTMHYMAFSEAVVWLCRHWHDVKAYNSDHLIMTEAESVSREGIKKAAKEGVWKRDDVQELDYLFHLSHPSEVLAETDIWALGVSMIKYANSDFVDRTCFTLEFFNGFVKLLPTEGPLPPIFLVKQYLSRLRNFYAPLYDVNATWKDFVPEAYWKSLVLTLQRSDVGGWFAPVKDEDKDDLALKNELRDLAHSADPEPLVGQATGSSGTKVNSKAGSSGTKAKSDIGLSGPPSNQSSKQNLSRQAGKKPAATSATSGKGYETRPKAVKTPYDVEGQWNKTTRTMVFTLKTREELGGESDIAWYPMFICGFKPDGCRTMKMERAFQDNVFDAVIEHITYVSSYRCPAFPPSELTKGMTIELRYPDGEMKQSATVPATTQSSGANTRSLRGRK